MIRHLDLFSGIGGFALAARMVGGIETVGFCEIDPYCQKVLAKNFPGVPIHDDVKTLKGDEYGRIDLITGGYPCQPFSVAGKQRGEDDDRHLWPEVFRLIKTSRPSWILCENVGGHIELGLDEVLTCLDGADYSARAVLIPACAANFPHRRDRVWIIAYANSIGSDRRLQGCFLAQYNAESEIESRRRRFSQIRRYSGREAASRLLRKDDGLSQGVDRCRALGNAIVPQVAAEILRCMLTMDSISRQSRDVGPLTDQNDSVKRSCSERNK